MNFKTFTRKILLFITIVIINFSCKGQKDSSKYNGIYQTGKSGKEFYLRSDSTQVFKVVKKDFIALNLFESSEVIFENSTPVLSITLNDNGKHQLDNLTAMNIKKHLPIIFNNELYTAPFVQERIKEGRLIISGFKTIEEANTILELINNN